jgi:tetratricopeptide (TPR) repeat protein
MPLALSCLARAYAELNQLDEARRCIGEAMSTIETTKESWFEAEVNRVAGKIALKSPESDAAKAEAYFERALEVARQQQAKSWELRAAMSMARLPRLGLFRRPTLDRDRLCIRGDIRHTKAIARYMRAIKRVNEVARHQGQQIYFGIAATNGHDADLACLFERNSPPAFAWPRGRPAAPRFAGTFSPASLAV